MVERLMEELILEQSMDTTVLVDEFGNRKEGKKKIPMKRGFAVYVCINIRKANENWVGHTITCHNRYIHLI